MNNAGLNFTIRKIAEGDPSAQAELHTLVYSSLVLYLTRGFHSSLSPEDIEEVASQSILLMFVNAATYRGREGDSSAWKWAYTIARNQALKWLKIRKREIPFSDNGGDGDPGADAYLAFQAINDLSPNCLDRGMEDQVIERLLQEKMMELFHLLDERERQILRLHYADGWTLKMIASHLKVTPARITQILQGILRKFRNDPDLSIQWESI